MKLLYRFPTRVGTFFVGRSADGRYHPIFKDESLGSYREPWQAAEDLAGGHTLSVLGVEDTATLNTTLLGEADRYQVGHPLLV